MKNKILEKNLKKKLREIVGKIKAYKPEKVILFGSSVYGQFRKGSDSDIDLLVIKKTQKPPQKRIEEVLELLYPKKWYLSETNNFPIDVLVYTPAEVEREWKLGDFFIEEILRKGKVVYEKPGH